MAYILVAFVGDLKYFVQKYDGRYILNGLIDNAVKYSNEEVATEAKMVLKHEFTNELFVTEVLPETN